MVHCSLADIHIIIDVRNRLAVDRAAFFPAPTNSCHIITKEMITDNDPNLVAIAFSVASDYQYYHIDDNRHLIGTFQWKINQLNLIGWRTIVVNTNLNCPSEEFFRRLACAMIA